MTNALFAYVGPALVGLLFWSWVVSEITATFAGIIPT